MTKKVVHYLNQFFGGIGREEMAHVAPRFVAGPVGPGMALEQALGEAARVVGTVICGDNYINEHRQEAIAAIVDMVREQEADILFAGPAFESGRYGMACGEVCREVGERLGIPTLASMSEKNPAVDMYNQDTLIVAGSDKALKMRADVAGAARLIRKVAAGEPLGPAREEGYIPRGQRRLAFRQEIGARRAVNMLLRKLAGQPIDTEITLPKFERVKAPAAVADLSKAVVALVSTGGIVAKGNPQRLETTRCTKWVKYDISGKDRLSPEEYQCIHGGYENTFANEDPNRVAPVDALRAFEKKGIIGKLYDGFYAYCGAMAVLDVAKRVAAEMIEDMRINGIDAVILTST